MASGLEVVREERNERGQVTYLKYSDGSWVKYGYNEKGFLNYIEDKVNGVVLDKRASSQQE